jgi:hypothetical protein
MAMAYYITRAHEPTSTQVNIADLTTASLQQCAFLGDEAWYGLDE